MNGYDFWHGTDAKERIVVDEIEGIHRTQDRVTVRSRGRWLIQGGETVCEEERTMVFRIGERSRSIDFTFVLSPPTNPSCSGTRRRERWRFAWCRPFA